ncbi:hypothetical protein HYV57_03110 [Candidatus Peregrinibacteria bacterium]|nr:hypothetical protein [Candidatus Peregrinibacteria bacterium]
MTILTIVTVIFSQNFSESKANSSDCKPFDPQSKGITRKEYPNGLCFPSFNAYTDNNSETFPDERNFLKVRNSNGTYKDYTDSLSVKPGDTLIFAAYIHNDADPDLNEGGKGPGVAKDVKLSVDKFKSENNNFVTEEATSFSINLTIKANNTTPKSVNNETKITSSTGKKIRLKYLTNTAYFDAFNLTENHYFSVNSFFGGGDSVGSPDIGSSIFWGCEEYRGYIYFNVIVEEEEKIECQDLDITPDSVFIEDFLDSSKNPTKSVSFGLKNVKPSNFDGIFTWKSSSGGYFTPSTNGYRLTTTSTDDATDTVKLYADNEGAKISVQADNSSVCKDEVVIGGRCGDGHVWSGKEECDDGPKGSDDCSSTCEKKEIPPSVCENLSLNNTEVLAITSTNLSVTIKPSDYSPSLYWNSIIGSKNGTGTFDNQNPLFSGSDTSVTYKNGSIGETIYVYDAYNQKYCEDTIEVTGCESLSASPTTIDLNSATQPISITITPKPTTWNKEFIWKSTDSLATFNNSPSGYKTTSRTVQYKGTNPATITIEDSTGLFLNPTSQFPYSCKASLPVTKEAITCTSLRFLDKNVTEDEISSGKKVPLEVNPEPDNYSQDISWQCTGNGKFIINGTEYSCNNNQAYNFKQTKIEYTGGKQNDTVKAFDVNFQNICNDSLIIEPPVITETFCGDGTVQKPNEKHTGGPNNDGNEECDDGNNNNGDGCSSTCANEGGGPRCGDKNIDTGEQCDDGNNNNGDGCSSTCANEGGGGPRCGDKNIDTGEQCDDGNNNNGDGCSSTCANEGGGGPRCGDKNIDTGEQCDDGNNNNGDGCSSTCANEGGGGGGGGACSIRIYTKNGTALFDGSQNPQTIDFSETDFPLDFRIDGNGAPYTLESKIVNNYAGQFTAYSDTQWKTIDQTLDNNPGNPLKNSSQSYYSLNNANGDQTIGVGTVVAITSQNDENCFAKFIFDEKSECASLATSIDTLTPAVTLPIEVTLYPTSKSFSGSYTWTTNISGVTFNGQSSGYTSSDQTVIINAPGGKITESGSIFIKESSGKNAACSTSIITGPYDGLVKTPICENTQSNISSDGDTATYTIRYYFQPQKQDEWVNITDTLSKKGGKISGTINGAEAPNDHISYKNDLKVYLVRENEDRSQIHECAYENIGNEGVQRDTDTLCFEGKIDETAGITVYNLRKDKDYNINFSSDYISLDYSGYIEASNDLDCDDIHSENECKAEYFLNQTDSKTDRNVIHTSYATVWVLCPYILTRNDADVYFEDVLNEGSDISCVNPANKNSSGLVITESTKKPADLGAQILAALNISNEPAVAQTSDTKTATDCSQTHNDVVGRFSSFVCEISTVISDQWKRYDATSLDEKLLATIAIDKRIEQNTTKETRYFKTMENSSGKLSDVNISTLKSFFKDQNPDSNENIYVYHGDLIIKNTIPQNITISGGEARTIIVYGNLTINSGMEYNLLDNNSYKNTPSIAFIVLPNEENASSGNIFIHPSVTKLVGVYYTEKALKSSNGNSHEKLVIQGSVYGNIEPLLQTRTGIGNLEKDEGSIVIQYDERIFLNTPPGLKDFVDIQLEEVAR